MKPELKDAIEGLIVQAVRAEYHEGFRRFPEAVEHIRKEMAKIIDHIKPGDLEGINGTTTPR